MRESRRFAKAGAHAGPELSRFSTSDAPAHRRVALWNEHASRAMTGLRVEPPRLTEFDAAYEAAQMQEVGFVEARSTRAHVTHLPVCGADPAYLIHLQRTGTSLNRQAGREVTLRPGDFVLCDLAQPCALDLSDDNTMLVLRIPAASLRRRMANPELFTNLHMRGDRGASSLASRFAALLWDSREAEAGPTATAKAAEALCDLISAAFQEARPQAEGSSARVLHRLRIQRHIEARLFDPDLTPASLAAELRISPRYLHRVFSTEEESIGKLILRKRLEACRAALADPRQAPKTISTIAYERGFNNTTYFARAFRDRYGVSPSEHRRSPAAPS